MAPSNKGYKYLKGLYDNKTSPDDAVPISIDGVQGTIYYADECIKPGKYVGLMREKKNLKSN